MSEVVICRHCNEPFELQPGKPGYRDECPLCLYERSAALLPKRSRLEKHLAARGLSEDRIAKKTSRLRGAVRESMRALGASDELIEEWIEQVENHSVIGSV